MTHVKMASQRHSTLELESREMDFFGLLTAPPVTNPVTFIREHLEKLSLHSSH